LHDGRFALLTAQMVGIRTLLRDNRLIVTVLLALALSVKLFVPQGYMLGPSAGTRYLAVQLCFDGVSHQITRIAVPGEDRSGDKSDGKSRPDQNCPFGGLSMGATGASDAPMVAPPLVFPPSRLLPPTEQARIAGPASLLPPSRGPPSFL
jgi:hypothetical protein